MSDLLKNIGRFIIGHPPVSWLLNKIFPYGIQGENAPDSWKQDNVDPNEEET